MTDKTKEVLRLALEALQTAHLAVEDDMLADEIQQAITAIREALAEQPAIKQDLTPEQPAQPQELAEAYRTELDKLSQRNYELRMENAQLKAQPQQEPHGYLKLSTAKFFHEVEGTNPMTDKNYLPLYTSPPASKSWVGLTDEEIRNWWRIENGLEDCNMAKLVDFTLAVRAIEAKLREKNA